MSSRVALLLPATQCNMRAGATVSVGLCEEVIKAVMWRMIV